MQKGRDLDSYMDGGVFECRLRDMGDDRGSYTCEEHGQAVLETIGA
jgi:hypothetical protein